MKTKSNLKNDKFLPDKLYKSTSCTGKRNFCKTKLIKRGKSWITPALHDAIKIKTTKISPIVGMILRSVIGRKLIEIFVKICSKTSLKLIKTVSCGKSLNSLCLNYYVKQNNGRFVRCFSYFGYNIFT